MGETYEVDCSDLDFNDVNRFSKVTNLGGRKEDGSRWGPRTPQRVAEMLHKGDFFFVLDPNGNRVPLHPHTRTEHGRTTEYVSTEPDRFVEDNLLSLPPCREKHLP